jgi:SAM-dependent methyltransferase
MSLTDEYRRQFALRAWARVLSLLPSMDGHVVLDLGCGIGDQALELTALGARVVGLEANQELLATAQARGIARANFRAGDLREPDIETVVDGIWCSFATAYVPDLGPTLARWKRLIKPGGWIALTEVDNLFGHEPVEADTREVFAAYARDALDNNRYDFHMGGKLRAYLEQAGYQIMTAQQVLDRELSFDGPADSEVVDAWNARLNRMSSLRDFCGLSFDAIRGDFIASLMRPDHRSVARVCFCLAVV